MTDDQSDTTNATHANAPDAQDAPEDAPDRTPFDQERGEWLVDTAETDFGDRIVHGLGASRVLLMGLPRMHGWQTIHPSLSLAHQAYVEKVREWLHENPQAREVAVLDPDSGTWRTVWRSTLSWRDHEPTAPPADADPGVYLAGPIDFADDPFTWRDEVAARYPGVGFVDPAERFPDYPDNPAVVVRWGLQQAAENDLLVVNIGDGGPRTVGTHHEIAAALHHGNRVAAVPVGDPSPFVEERDAVTVHTTIDAALAALRPDAEPDADAPLTALDGGGA